MANTQAPIQYMSISYEELESGAPAICFCSEFTIAISNKTLSKSFINYYDNDLRFKLGTLSGNKLAFKWFDEESGALEVYFKNNFMGYALCGELYNAFTNVYKCLQEQSQE